MTEEDYIAWRENPVTRWVMAACEASAELCKRQWQEASWETGVANQAALNELRAKHKTWRGIIDASFDDIQARITNG